MIASSPPAVAPAQLVRAFREHLEISQSDLARQIGCHVSVISRIEGGLRPSRHTRRAISRVLTFDPWEPAR